MKKTLLILATTGFVFTSCIKHEVIPAPVPTVDLYAHFYGVIDGAEIELTENVLDYVNVSTKAKIILPPPQFSSAVYYSELQSPSVQTSIKVGMGSIDWDASIAPDPALTSFNSFFLSNENPNYSNNGSNGFEAVFTDGSGREWASNEFSANQQNVQFTGIVQESDSTGDYSLFVCNFDCWAYSLNPDSLAQTPPVVHTDSIKIQDAVYHGWFRR